jgi:hypothetical protein
MDTSSPWSRAGAPSGTLPPPPTPPIPAPPTGAPLTSVFPQGPKPRRRGWLWIALGLALVIVASAATGSLVTFAAMHNATQSAAQPSSAPPASPSAPTPQVSAADASAAKDHLCKVFDTSVRGQEGQGGLREQGNLNLPVVLRALNSASAVQNALVPSVPPETATAARKYIGATLDQTTAAMGNTLTPEVNRLTDVRNDAINDLLDACGLPR